MNNSEVVNAFGIDKLMRIHESVQRAYSYAEIFIQNTDILNLKSARSAHQIIRNLAVDLSLEKDCLLGRIKMGYCYQSNKQNNSHHLELFSEGKILTHSSTNHCILPRRAIFREEYASTNQISLFDSEHDLTTQEPRYGIITHSPICANGLTCSSFLVIPDIDYGYACNQIPLSDISSPFIIYEQSKSEYEEFDFALKDKIKEKDL